MKLMISPTIITMKTMKAMAIMMKSGTTLYSISEKFSVANILIVIKKEGNKNEYI